MNGNARSLRSRTAWLGSADAHRSIVAEHTAGGCCNAEIATRMSISRRTVSTHVSSVLKKLDMTSRVGLAGEVIRRQQRNRSRPYV
ncbi:response regulator transcription factor [Streptomyces sioyaensis]|uniref:response regulator transcription factor n=1 Tax=Streptomyces sioyaensis TaxID=67364 RepID=UPI003D75FCEE